MTTQYSASASLPSLILLPNSYKEFLQKLTGVFAIVLLPLLISYILITQFTGLSGANLGLSMAGVAALLTLAYGLWVKTKDQACEQVLTITGEGVSLSCEKHPTLTTSWDEVRIERLGWGPDMERMLPAVRISMPGRKPFTVGAAEADTTWQEVSRSVEATDFIIETEADWKLLMSASAIA